MSLGCGTAPGAKNIAGQRAVLLAGGVLEETGDCLLGRASALGNGFSGSDAPVPLVLPYSSLQRAYSRRAQSGLLWFIVSEQSWVGFSLVSSS
jgi:hypothetical protein